jgi:hypothetical protein
MAAPFRVDVGPSKLSSAPHRHTVDHETLVVAGSQVPGLSTTFSGSDHYFTTSPREKNGKSSTFFGEVEPY